MSTKLVYIIFTIIVKSAFSENERFCEYKGCDSIVCNNTNYGVTIANCPKINTLKITKNRFTSLEHLVPKNVSINNLYLEEINLLVIPAGIFKKILVNDSISLSNNRIEEIRTNTFDGISSLDSLDLSYNRIRKLQNNSIPKAKMVNLNWNFIEEIDESMFVDFGFLQKLHLEHNCIKFPKSFNTTLLVRISYESMDESYCSRKSENFLSHVKIMYVAPPVILIVIIIFLVIILVKFRKSHLRNQNNELNIRYERKEDIRMKSSKLSAVTEYTDEQGYIEPITHKKEIVDPHIYESIPDTTKSSSYDKLGDVQNSSSYDKLGDRQSNLYENTYLEMK